MITKYKYTSDRDRSFEKDFDFADKTIIDFGSAMLADNVHSKYFNVKNNKYATVDLFEIPDSKLHFEGNINSLYLWNQIFEHVKKYDKFDYCLISHTLEDISNPILACRMMPLIAKQGCIIVPSKYRELTRDQQKFRGFPHHKWIFNIESNNFVGYPKLNFIEYFDHFDNLENLCSKENSELQIYWDINIDLKIINNDFLGPTNKHVFELYKNLHLN